MTVRTALLVALLGCLPAYAGEIVIIQSPDSSRSVREPSRSERELGRTMDKARQHVTGGAAPVVIDDSTGTRLQDSTEQSIRDAQDYLRPATGSATPDTGGTTVILRAAPTETEKVRQKARSYVVPEAGSKTVATCEVGNTVGTIGGVAGNERTTNVIEKGNSAVIVHCK